jgi:hypothetical protein
MKFGKFSLKTISKKGVIFGLSAGVALGVTGAAFAYWTSSGTGSGSVATGTTVGVTVVQTTVVTGMYPGEAAIPLVGNFTNTNSGPVKVGTVTATLGTLPTGCVAGDFTITGSGVVNAEIPSGTAQGAWSGISIQMNDTAVNQDGCKIQTVPLTYSVSAAA